YSLLRLILTLWRASAPQGAAARALLSTLDPLDAGKLRHRLHDLLIHAAMVLHQSFGEFLHLCVFQFVRHHAGNLNFGLVSKHKFSCEESGYFLLVTLAVALGGSLLGRSLANAAGLCSTRLVGAALRRAWL